MHVPVTHLVDAIALAIALMFAGVGLIYAAVLLDRQDKEIARLKGEKSLG